MSFGMLSWLGEEVREARKVQPGGRLSVEPLEPRVLLSAGLAGVQPVLSDEAVPVDPAIFVDLDQRESPRVLTLDASFCEQPSRRHTAPQSVSPAPSRQAQPGALAVERFGVSPALFVENQGQWSDPSVRYVHDGEGFDVAMTDTSVVFRAVDTDLQMLQFSASFVGANAVRPVGLEQSESLFNYYLGDPANWRPNVSSCKAVAYEGLYEGVDLRIQGLRSHVKHEFHVSPGADYSRIAVRYEGIEGLSLGEDGSLEVNLGASRGVLRDEAPYMYQEIDGRKVEVAGRFVLLDDRTYGFEVDGEIDPDHVLVIDPDLIWNTYLGGGNRDRADAIVVDSSGSVYATGQTCSVAWTSGGYDTTLDGISDAFVAKLSSSGAHLWSTYVGGSSEDAGFGIAVDFSGNVYVTGSTSSSGWTRDGYDTTLDGLSDAFVAKLSSGGARLWSTCVGGSSKDAGLGIAADCSGNVYVTGSTSSSGWKTGGYDTAFDGSSDAFVAKLSPSGAHVWSTYLGGNRADGGAGIAVDPSGSIYVAGSTNSSGWATGGFDTTYHGGGDAFVAKLDFSGTHVWSTYLGGSGRDYGYGIALDALGVAYVTGHTYSAGWTSGGFDTTYDPYWDLSTGFGGDAFVASLSSGGVHLWSTYLDGSTSVQETGTGVGVGPSSVYVTGYIVSGGGNCWRAFVASLTSVPDTTPPSPDPSTWSTGPYATGETSIRMVATRATDPRGVQYYFDETSGNPGGTDSGWQESDEYEDTGLSPGTTYTYRVKTRDKSAAQNETGYSIARWATAQTPDTVPPTILAFSVSPASARLGDPFLIAYLVSDSGGSGLNSVQLWRTEDPNVWPAQPVAQDSGLGNGPVTATLVDIPPSVGDWWYGIRVFDTAGNSITETQGGGQPIHVVVHYPPEVGLAHEIITLAENTDSSSRIKAAEIVVTDDAFGTHVLSLGGVDAILFEIEGSTLYLKAGAALDHETNPQLDVTVAVDDVSGAPTPDDTASLSIAVADVNERPRKPMCSSPADGATAVILTPILRSSAFSDPDAGDTHATAQWQVDDTSDFSRPVWDYEDTDSDRTGQAVPSTTLFYSTTYHWRVRYQDSHGLWSEWSDSRGFTVDRYSPVYRFWKRAANTHFYTIKESEKDKLIRDYADIYSYEGPAYYAYGKDQPPAGTLPVYRFWKASDNTHFYTIKESEKQKLIDTFSQTYTYEGPAFYAYGTGAHPLDTLPVYRFWKPLGNTHFFTIKESEKDKLIDLFSSVFTFENVVWYAYGV